MALVIDDSPVNPFLFSFLEPVANPGPDPQNFSASATFTYADNAGSEVEVGAEIEAVTNNMGNVDRFGNNLAVVSFGPGTGITAQDQTTGTVAVDIDVPYAYYNRIGSGETVILKWTLKVTDDVGGQTDTTNLWLTITGRNDSPTAFNDSIVVSDLTSQFTNGAVLANDDDPDINDDFTVTGVGAVGAAVAGAGTILPAEYVAQTPGTASFDANSVTVDFNRYYKFLAVGESVTFNVPYSMSDGHGGSSIANVVTTITGTATKAFKGTNAGEQMLGEDDVDKMSGKDGNDTIFARAGNDILNGEKGNDILVGGLGADDLFGEKGKDIFQFLTAADSGKKGSQRDVIFDFDNKDKVDLSPIDPIAGGLDDAFKWRGTKNFSGNRPELNYDKVGTKVVLFGDVNGDGKADFAVQFNGLSTLSKGDFEL